MISEIVLLSLLLIAIEATYKERLFRRLPVSQFSDYGTVPNIPSVVSISHKSSLAGSDKNFVSFSTCNPTACSHWLTQSQKEADIYYLFIIG